MHPWWGEGGRGIALYRPGLCGSSAPSTGRPMGSGTWIFWWWDLSASHVVPDKPLLVLWMWRPQRVWEVPESLTKIFVCLFLVFIVSSPHSFWKVTYVFYWLFLRQRNLIGLITTMLMTFRFCLVGKEGLLDFPQHSEYMCNIFRISLVFHGRIIWKL